MKPSLSGNRDIGNQPDPLGDGPVLLALLGKDPLHAERLQRRHLTTVTSAKDLGEYFADAARTIIGGRFLTSPIGFPAFRY